MPRDWSGKQLNASAFFLKKDRTVVQNTGTKPPQSKRSGQRRGCTLRPAGGATTSRHGTPLRTALWAQSCSWTRPNGHQALETKETNCFFGGATGGRHRGVAPPQSLAGSKERPPAPCEGGEEGLQALRQSCVPNRVRSGAQSSAAEERGHLGGGSSLLGAPQRGA